MNIAEKIMSLEDFLLQKPHLKAAQKSLIFTNGCFDILHKGHVDYLEKARKMGDFLILGLNSDASVKAQNKATNRPINRQEDRAFLLAAFFFIDAVIIFDAPTPVELIEKISPDILVKGGDYDPNEKNPASKKYIVGGDWVLERGGKLAVLPFLEGYSTTKIIEKIRQ